MATKRPKGNDATQDLSLSDLMVPGRPPGKPPGQAPRGSNPKNDMSLWGGAVLSTSDFAPAPAAAKRSPKKWIIGGVLAGVAIAAVLVVVTRKSGDAKKSDAVATAPKNDTAETKGQPADTKTVAKTEATKPEGKGSAKSTTSGSAAAASTGSAGATASATGSAGATATATGSASATGSAGSTGSAGAASAAGAAMPVLMANGKEVDAISGVASVIRAKKAPVRKAPVKKTAAKAVVKKPAPKVAPKKK